MTELTATGIPFGRLVRAEWGKATDTRAARWLMVLTGVATIAIMAAPALAAGSIDQTYLDYLSFAAIFLTSLLPIVGILALTSEWTQRTALTTFVQEPRRARVVWAKVVATVLVSLAAAAFGAVVVAATVGTVAAFGRHLDANLGIAQLLGFPLFVVVNMLIGSAFGAVLQNTAAAIVLMFVLPIGFGVLGAVLHAVGDWLDPGTTFNWLLLGQWDGHAAQLATATVLWIVLPLVAGVWRTVHREIK